MRLTTPPAARAFAPARFAFWIQAAAPAYNSVQRSRPKAVTHRPFQPSASQFFLDKLARFFANPKARSESGKGRFSRRLLSLFRPAVAELARSGERRGLFYENENFTYKKFNEPLTFLPRFPSHPACACLL